MKDKENSPKKVEKKKSVSLTMIAWISSVAVVIGLVIVSSRFSYHQIDGPSMEPTFKQGEWIAIHKGQSPQRFDIVTFSLATKANDFYVKRIIGMPNDGVRVDGEWLSLTFQKDQSFDKRPVYLQKESHPDGKYLKIKVSPKIATELAPYDRIPEGYYFVLGDHLNNSNDSRDFGFVEARQLEGVVWFRYFPFSKIGKIPKT